MSFVPTFQPTGLSFEERIGAPEEFDAAVGLVALGFSGLEEQLSETIARLLDVDESTGSAVTSEMSFGNKVHLFGSLVRVQFVQRSFNTGNSDVENHLRDLVAACFRCEAMRNQIMHSSWSLRSPHSNKVRQRRKTTAKASRGIHKHQEDLTAASVLDIYDYILNIDYLLYEFMITYHDGREQKPAT